MAILQDHFYHKTIHFYTSVFGTIFNNIKIVRDDGNVIKVPLSYAGQNKDNTILEQGVPSAPTKTRYKMRLPRLSYALISWTKDESRLTNRNFKFVNQNTDRTLATTVPTQYNRVPYIFNYEVNSKTKNIDDLLQIVEQIVVYFNSAIQVVVQDNPYIDETTALTIRMTDSSMTNQYEGEYTEQQVIEAKFDFALEGYLYMPDQTDKFIKTVTINTRELMNPDELLDQYTHE